MTILSNLYVILILRILHIGSGIVWVGSATLYLLLIIPAARSAQSAGQKFLQTLGPKFGAMMGIVTTVTVLSGALLYVRFFAGGISFIWTTGAGFAFTVGAVAALGSYVMGAGFFGKMQARIEKLGAEMESAQSAPNPAQVQEMNRLQSSLMKAYQFDLVLLAVAMLAMAVARYL
ncbi:MAG: hypothetical protein C4583_12070 [Anaerolineaceae bacterium]|nr:MAG: hypothetical protein C4583_12070 [Anaerolineaceae bacterium]